MCQQSTSLQERYQARTSNIKDEGHTEEECAFLPRAVEPDKHSRTGESWDQGPHDR